jgi:nitrate/nitrite transport system ATP-binding protein
MRPYLEIWNLSKSFPCPGGSGQQTVVSDFNLSLRKGEFVSIIGHSGCGKSTVLSVLAGLATPTFGVAILAGKEITGPGIDRGVVFQSPSLLHWLNAEQNVCLGLDEAMKSQDKAHRLAASRHYLGLVGLAGFERARVSDLSAGMRQRVGLARAFALSPRMLLLDEPFGMLDSLTRFELQEVLLEVWAERKMTALMVTHDVDEALFLSDRVVAMTSGPNAHVGAIIDVQFARPRQREAVLKHPDYYSLRARLIDFLEGQIPHGAAPKTEEATEHVNVHAPLDLATSTS